MPDTDRRRPLGTTGMRLSPVGLGTWAMGGGGWSWSWGPQDDDASVATIRRAVESGINWLDTAAEYGLGHAEEVVGRAIAGLPEADRPYVFTKCGMVWDPHRPMVDAVASASPATVRAGCEASLRRLGVERIDLFQVHWPPEQAIPVEEYWATMVELRAEGKIRAAGLSNHDVDQLAAAGTVGHVDSLQPPFSLIERDAAAGLLPWCRANGTGVIAYSPLQSGLLTGRFDARRVATLPAGDWRRRSPDFNEHLPATLALVERLQQIAAARAITPASAALAWLLAWDGVTGAIVGARRPAQLGEWIAAGDIELDGGTLDEVAEALEATGAGRGPVHPRRAPAPVRPTGDLPPVTIQP